MITLDLTKEVWGDQREGRREVELSFFTILSNGRYLAHIVLRSRLYYTNTKSLLRKYDHAVQMYGGPLKRYMGTMSVTAVMVWLGNMGYTGGELFDAAVRTGWRRSLPAWERV